MVARERRLLQGRQLPPDVYPDPLFQQFLSQKQRKVLASVSAAEPIERALSDNIKLLTKAKVLHIHHALLPWRKV